MKILIISIACYILGCLNGYFITECSYVADVLQYPLKVFSLLFDLLIELIAKIIVNMLPIIRLFIKPKEYWVQMYSRRFADKGKWFNKFVAVDAKFADGNLDKPEKIEGRSRINIILGDKAKLEKMLVPEGSITKVHLRKLWHKVYSL